MKFAYLKRIINILILIIGIICIVPFSSNATNDLSNAGVVKEDVKTLQKLPRHSGIDIGGGLEGMYQTDSTVNSIGAKIIGVAQFICYGAAFIILLIKGVQFMQKAPEARAEFKKELVNYVIGAFILFGIGAILTIIGNISRNVLFK